MDLGDDAGVGEGEEPCLAGPVAARDPDFTLRGGGAVANPAAAGVDRDAEAALVGGLVGLLAEDEAGRGFDGLDWLAHSEPLSVNWRPGCAEVSRAG